MNYEHFDDESSEYVITNPRTPVKWINYIGTLQFGGFIDHTGGMLICKGDPAKNPDHLCKGVTSLTVGGQQAPGHRLRTTGYRLRIEDPPACSLAFPFFLALRLPARRGYLAFFRTCSLMRWMWPRPRALTSQPSSK